MTDMEHLELSEQEIKQLALKAQREYKRQWRARNKDKIRASNQRYWYKKAMRQIEETKE